ncbi:hypothetical protein C8R43DRAFT_975140 [Mycena crocata]|nr:hypothetical protein C8R43DRAFT_975140 [Mycena crocata]
MAYHTIDGVFPDGICEDLDSQTVVEISLHLQNLEIERHLRSYTYPVLTLPSEIISEVFLEALDPDKASPSCAESPLFLGHICQQWRQIAVSTPRLWTQLSLEIVDPMVRDNQLQILDLWLTRSRDCPISISIVDLARVPQSMREFVTAILPHSKRCKTLNVVLPDNDLSVLVGQFPLLRSLSIGFSDEIPMRPYTVGAFREAPTLDTVVVYTGGRIGDLSLPWRRITSLHIRNGWVCRELVDVLHAAVQLAILGLEITFSEMDAATAFLPEIPPLIYLHTLDLIHPSQGDPAPDSQMRLLHRLTLPSLRHLRVSEPYFALDPIWSITDWALHSSFPLKELCIEIAQAHRTYDYYRSGLPLVGTIIVDEVNSDLQIGAE